MNRNDIIDALNADDWKMVKDAFQARSIEFIRGELEYMFNEVDEDLAQAIYNELD